MQHLMIKTSKIYLFCKIFLGIWFQMLDGVFISKRSQVVHNCWTSSSWFETPRCSWDVIVIKRVAEWVHQTPNISFSTRSMLKLSFLIIHNILLPLSILYSDWDTDMPAVHATNCTPGQRCVLFCFVWVNGRCYPYPLVGPITNML